MKCSKVKVEERTKLNIVFKPDHFVEREDFSRLVPHLFFS